MILLLFANHSGGLQDQRQLTNAINSFHYQIRIYSKTVPKYFKYCPSTASFIPLLSKQGCELLQPGFEQLTAFGP